MKTIGYCLAAVAAAGLISGAAFAGGSNSSNGLNSSNLNELNGNINDFLIDHGPTAGTLTLGVGVICNTSGEAEHYVSLRKDGAHVQPAVHQVNSKAHDPQGCGLAAIAYRRDKTLDMQTVQGKLVSIVRVNVIGGFDGRSWKPVPQTTQYAVMRAKGLMI